MSYILVLYIYAGVMAKGDSVAMTTVPQPSFQACQAAGREAAELVKGSFKELRFICLKS